MAAASEMSDGSGALSEARSAHSKWWSEYYSRSSVSLPAHPQLQRLFDSMLYLQRASMRVGKVAPGLWGPFSTTDFPAWSDQFTLDYNFQANFWAATGTNHAELVSDVYSKFIFGSRLIPLARARAALPDWSLGGWPDRLGASVMGMSCGPTPDWDHDFGCEGGFGGFDGLAFVSCAGPFESMECSFDDGTRFVAGLVATPMLQYYDGTQDAEYLGARLLPFLRGVAEFYTSYARWDAEAQRYVLPWTCAQEICAGSGPVGRPAAEHNNHQDLAYARMAYARLLELTTEDPAASAALRASPAERATWSRMLAQLAPFPVASAAGPAGTAAAVFAEAVALPLGGPQPAPDSNSAYPITHLAAMYPAHVVDRFSAPPELLATARSTVELINRATDFAPGNGFVLSWPPAAVVADEAIAGALLANFSRAYARRARPNGWPDLGGGGLEQIGALTAIQMMLVRVVDGVLRLFPGWPREAPAAFANLRVSGAFLVSATRGEDSVTIVSEAGRPILLPPDLFGGVAVCSKSGPPAEPTRLRRAAARDHFILHTQAGKRYELVPCPLVV